MSKTVLFVQHDHVSPPSTLGAAFEDRGFDVELFQVVPAGGVDRAGLEVTYPDPRRYDAIVPMGARWSVYDLQLIGSWVEPEMAMLRAAVTAGVPVLGVCFGGQLLAQAHNGAVEASDAPEVGWQTLESDVDFLQSGPWFQWHSDRWTVPSGAREIARNAAASQAFVLGRALALQFHPELTVDMLQGWLDNGGDQQLLARGVDPRVLLNETLRLQTGARERTFQLVDGFLTQVATGVISARSTANPGGLSR